MNLLTPLLMRSYNELLELQLVLERAAAFFEDARSQADVSRNERSAFGGEGEPGMGGGHYGNAVPVRCRIRGLGAAGKGWARARGLTRQW